MIFGFTDDMHQDLLNYYKTKTDNYFEYALVLPLHSLPSKNIFPSKGMLTNYHKDLFRYVGKKEN